MSPFITILILLFTISLKFHISYSKNLRMFLTMNILVFRIYQSECGFGINSAIKFNLRIWKSRIFSIRERRGLKYEYKAIFNDTTTKWQQNCFSQLITYSCYPVTRNRKSERFSATLPSEYPTLDIYAVSMPKFPSAIWLINLRTKPYSECVVLLTCVSWNVVVELDQNHIGFFIVICILYSPNVS